MRNQAAILLLIILGLAGDLTAQTEPNPPLESVPDINGLAVSLTQPEFPSTAVAVDADGATTSVRVVVDENGNVLTAVCSLTCHPMLRDAAEIAARRSTFKPRTRDGRPVKYQGILLYTFVVNRVNWFRFATALESTRQFDNISLGPVAQILSDQFVKQRESLASLDANGGADYGTRQKVIDEVTASFRSVLKDADLWWFELGLSLRRVTFWAMAAERIDRPRLQSAIADLARVVAASPEDVPQGLIAEITSISQYKIPAQISEQDLRMKLGEMSRRLWPHLR
jgi:hypothetical protein